MTDPSFITIACDGVIPSSTSPSIESSVPMPGKLCSAFGARSNSGASPR
jgi:hypothetical protein